MRFFIILIFLVSSLLAGMKVYVSHNSQINMISKQDLKNLYLKKTQLLKGKRVIVYDNEDDYSKFYNQVINKTDGQIHAYWMKQIFLGENVPPKRISHSEIVTILNKNPAAISYSEKYLDAKVIYEYK